MTHKKAFGIGLSDMKYLQQSLKKKMLVAPLLFLLLTALVATPASGEQSLGQAANDPTVSLMSVQIQDSYSGDFHQLEDEDANTIILRPVVPFTIGGIHNIARATIPFITHNPTGKTGLGDSVLFDLIVFKQSWGRWGLGPVMLLPTADKDELGAGGRWPGGRLRRAGGEIYLGPVQPEHADLCRCWYPEKCQRQHSATNRECPSPSQVVYWNFRNEHYV